MASGKPSGAAGDERRVAAFIAKFDPKDQRVIRALRRGLRKRLPTAHELVYDNYNFLVFAYGPTARPSDAIVSIAARAGGASLCFLHGARLPDPQRVLQGSGKQTRFLRLDSPAVLARPEVEALIAAAVARARARFEDAGSVRLVIRSVSAKQLPRRKPATRR